jgi:phosphatidylserine/phosphatidylglycerophosphate/cardiolipin synthase-like enzyme/uncharacterized membrane protein YdjX (TVP38/TMEM64 family)
VPILQPDRNIWRLESASRFSVFRDVASCFAAVRSSLLKARSTITIVGWDIDSRCRLVGSAGEPTDGFPAELGPFLGALGDRAPDLKINLLLWDFSPIYALEREAFPRAKLAWSNVDLWLDDCLPTGSSQHQKLIIVDEAVAYSGGLDLTIRRWDTCRHELNDPHRIDPGGTPYDPFHDVQAIADGDAARALAEVARQRWLEATGSPLPPSKPGDPWPDDVKPDFENVSIGIARTVPAHDGKEEVREVEKLFCDMIESAETSLYIENQFLSSGLVAEAIARRVREKPDLNVLLVAPQSLHSWIEVAALTYGRARFRRILETSNAMDRIRLACPRVSAGKDAAAVMVHSKVMIVDDRMVRIGSANLNNRSMGADSECDLVIEAREPQQRERITDLRNELIAMHCGVEPGEVAKAVASTGLIAASRALRRDGRSLEDIRDPEANEAEYARYLDRIADPERPIDEKTFLAVMGGDDSLDLRLTAARKLAIVALVLLALAAGWTATTQDVTGSMSSAFEKFADSPVAGFAVVAVYVVGGFALLPITVLIVATSAAFGLSWGLAYAACGTLASAATSYGVGAWLGKESVRRITGGKLLRIRDAIRRRGVLAIAAIRMVPVAPFTVVNLAAGALGVGFLQYVIGTLVGMAPGFIVLSVLGHGIYQLISEPSLATLAAGIGVLLLWGATALAVKHLMKPTPRAV